MSIIKDDTNKKPKEPLVITKQPPKKAKLGSPDVIGQAPLVPLAPRYIEAP
jgi:hypothetical protein